MIPAPRRLAAVRTLHTAIYAVMSAGVFVILLAGLTGVRGPWLSVALALLAVETVVFTASGFRCPLTAVVARYADGAPVSDTWLPERLTRHTVKVFAPLLALGLALLAARAATGHWGA